MTSSKVFRKIIISLCAIILVITTAGVLSFAEDQCPAGGEHDYTVTIVKRATENSDGLRNYVCSKCGRKYTETIPATGHIWSEWKVSKAPACTVDGQAVRKCIKHKDFTHYEYKVLPATGHDFGKWIIDRKATAAAAGMEHRVCRNDPSHVQYRSIPVLKTKGPVINDNSITKDDQDADHNSTVAHKNKVVPRNKVIGTRTVPFGAADAAIIGANGVSLLFFIILLLPMIRVMFWIAGKRKEAEDKEQ
jgi:hypothetical protein